MAISAHVMMRMTKTSARKPVGRGMGCKKVRVAVDRGERKEASASEGREVAPWWAGRGMARGAGRTVPVWPVWTKKRMNKPARTRERGWWNEDDMDEGDMDEGWWNEGDTDEGDMDEGDMDEA
eukprot:365885-Chlamydomonas_euryale.AAC.12